MLAALVVACAAGVAGLVCVGIAMVRVRDFQRRFSGLQQHLQGLPRGEVRQLRRRVARGRPVGPDEQRAACIVAEQMVLQRRQVVAGAGSACFAVAVGAETVLLDDAFARLAVAFMGLVLALVVVGAWMTVRDARAGERYLAERGSPAGQ